MGVKLLMEKHTLCLLDSVNQFKVPKMANMWRFSKENQPGLWHFISFDLTEIC